MASNNISRYAFTYFGMDDELAGEPLERFVQRRLPLPSTNGEGAIRVVAFGVKDAAINIGRDDVEDFQRQFHSGTDRPIVFVVALDAKSEASFKSPTATEEFDAMISSKFSGTFGSHDFKPVYYYVTRDEILRRVPRGWFTLDKVLMGLAVALLLVGLTDWNIFQTNSSPCQCGWQLQRQAEEMKNLSLALQSCTAERDPGRLPALVDAAQLIAPQVKESHTQRSERVTTEGALPEAVQATSDSSIEPENQILNITAQPESDASQLEEPLQGQSDPSHQATGTSDTPASPQDSAGAQ